MDLRALRREAQSLAPVMSIGKNGITAGSVTLLQRELDQKRLVKVKLLKAFVDGNDRKEAAQRLASFSGALLVQVVGNVVVLAKR